MPGWALLQRDPAAILSSKHGIKRRSLPLGPGSLAHPIVVVVPNERTPGGDVWILHSTPRAVIAATTPGSLAPAFSSISAINLHCRAWSASAGSCPTSEDIAIM